MNIFVKMFDDKLVIESPGGFPPFVTPANIYDSHNPRNPRVMDAMFYLDFVKCHNEGTRRMRAKMVESSLPPPEFQQKEIATGNVTVRVTLRNKIKQRKEWIDSDASKVIGPELAATLNDNERRVVNWIAENGGSINASECQRVTNTKTWHSAKKILQSLTERGILEHVHRTDIQRDPDAHFVLKSLRNGKAREKG